ncbi:MAG TPA: methanol/ethanol family PQQ-dependent dehydrogenase [Gemmatimonadaceae bacterium]
MDQARVPRIAAVAALLAIAAGCGRASAKTADSTTAGNRSAGAPRAITGAPGYAIPAGASAPQADGEWVMPGRDYANSRYSPLTEINASNVQHLKVATTMSTGLTNGFEGQPLVVGSTMYVNTPFPNFLISVDLTKPGGAVNWIYQPHPDPASVGIACCDIVNRGAVLADGKIIYNTLDAHTVAVDATSGHQLWKTNVGDIEVGETITMAPIVAEGVVLVGNSGAELGVRGYLAGLDVNTGKVLWRAYSTGPDRDVLIGPRFKAFYPKDRGKDLGLTSWTGEQWKLGGGTVWGWISYDPETKLVFYGTANPGVWNPDQRPGDNRWSTTVFARDPRTGEAKWAYQFGPHDAWDYDGVNEFIVADIPVNGKARKVLFHPDRNGFAYTIDRLTGEVLVAQPYVLANWATGIDLKTGRPIEVPEKRPHQGRVTRDICPSATGGKDQQPSAFSPRTGMFYIPAHNVCMNFEGVEANYIAGTPYLGASVKMFPGPGGYRGELLAWDASTGRKIWGVKEDLPLWSGVLATAGDLVFYGTMDGWLKALDARTGAERWKFKTGSGIVGSPIAYRGPDGKEYIAVYSGVGGWMGAVAFPSLSIDDPYAALGVTGAVPDIKLKTAPGGMLYVFTL